MLETLLVTGIHREELDFGDRVAALIDRNHVHVMRIPEGISHARTGSGGLFYYNTRHREIYLQLRQQVTGHYRLLIDLHCGLNDTGRCADLYCRDEQILQCISGCTGQLAMGGQLRLVKILTDSENGDLVKEVKKVDVGARTSIPEQMWNDQSFVYVGLEIYLAKVGDGVAADWRFARDLIDFVRDCAIDRMVPALEGKRYERRGNDLG